MPILTQSVLPIRGLENGHPLNASSMLAGASNVEFGRTLVRSRRLANRGTAPTGRPILAAGQAGRPSGFRIARARAAGDLADGVEPESAARLLVCFVEGLRVVGKTGPARSTSQATVDALLDRIIR